MKEPAGVWKVTERSELGGYGPTYSLFVDGIKRASCGESLEFGHAMAWSRPNGDITGPADRSIQCIDLARAELRCLEFVGLDVADVDRSAWDREADRTTADGVPPAYAALLEDGESLAT